MEKENGYSNELFYETSNNFYKPFFHYMIFFA